MPDLRKRTHITLRLIEGKKQRKKEFCRYVRD